MIIRSFIVWGFINLQTQLPLFALNLRFGHNVFINIYTFIYVSRNHWCFAELVRVE